MPIVRSNRWLQLPLNHSVSVKKPALATTQPRWDNRPMKTVIELNTAQFERLKTIAHRLALMPRNSPRLP